MPNTTPSLCRFLNVALNITWRSMQRPPWTTLIFSCRDFNLNYLTNSITSPKLQILKMSKQFPEAQVLSTITRYKEMYFII